MSSLAGPLSGIHAPADLWDASAANGLDGLGALVYRSNLLGADRSIANQGGGNTSAKGVVVDHAGRDQRVLWVKGSGTDLATITGDGFAAAAARRGRAAPFTRGDGRRVDGRLPPPLRAGARPAAPVHRDAPACVRGRSARRPHASGRRHRADVDAQRPLARRRGVRRRGGLARLSAPGLRHVEADRRAPRSESVRPRRPARAPRPRHVGQHVRGGVQEHHRVRHESCRGGGHGPEPAGSVWAAGRARSSGRASASPSWRRRFLRSAARSSQMRTASCSRSTGAPRRSHSPRRREPPR